MSCVRRALYGGILRERNIFFPVESRFTVRVTRQTTFRGGVGGDIVVCVSIRPYKNLVWEQVLGRWKVIQQALNKNFL